jgi:dTDP-4-dehydrorhamnose reductase
VKILLFGGSGQLGFELKKRASDLDFSVISPVTAEVDITDKEQVLFLAQSVKPSIIINAAAYTAVDKAEEEKEKAFAINRDGARNIAEACSRINVRMIQISTDYVFDGLLGRPVKEDDPTNPQSVYGASKLEGEQAIESVLGDRGLILRTSSLHGQKGVNFVHTMLKLFQEKEVVRVVNDQWMSPTWAGWLAEAVLDFSRMDCGGVVHASCSGGISWFEFATGVLELAQPHLEGKKLARIEPTTAAELNRPARRPTYSVFDLGKISSLLGRPPLQWREGLANHLKDIGIG